MARTGRRPGDTDTRIEILDAARHQFTDNGYTGATIRGIASEAAVDPALVHHYFGSKSDLFVAALDIPVNPASILADLVEEGTDGLGERIVATMLTAWDAADVNPVLMVVRSLAEGGRTADLLREFVTHNVILPLAVAIAAQGDGGERGPQGEGERQRAGGRGPQGEGERQRAGGRGQHDAQLRATLAASQFVGLLMVRYVAAIEPLASLPPDEVARIVGPNVQHYLVGELTAH
jgi:AcrR family transcriptional regulator